MSIGESGGGLSAEAGGLLQPPPAERVTRPDAGVSAHAAAAPPAHVTPPDAGVPAHAAAAPPAPITRPDAAVPAHAADVPARIGIMAALHDEVAALVAAMGPNAHVHTVGQRDYYVGTLMGCECVLVLARIGKVAAAATAVTLIREFNAGSVIFAGLAGAVATDVRVGDVVVARHLLQHDINASPLFPRYEVPLLGRSHFDTCEVLTATLAECATRYLTESFPHEINAATRHQFGVDQPIVHVGTIASGDCFVNDMAGVAALRQALPEVLCVEMEGAAVAQICHEYSIPCAVFRTISDRADDSAGVDFSAFLTQVASFYSAGILQRFLSTYALAATPNATVHR